jgi:formylglycine-generating enzyme required for sulfatase activity
MMKEWKFLVAICSVLLQPAAAWAYMPGNVVELSWELVINHSDGYRQIACADSVSAEGVTRTDWGAALSVSSDDSKKKRGSGGNGIKAFCNAGSAGNLPDDSGIRSDPPRLSVSGSIRSSVQRQMENERVLAVEFNAKVQMPHQAEDEEREALTGTEISRELFFTGNSTVLLPLWVQTGAARNLAGVSELFLRISAREPKSASKSVYGSLWVMSDLEAAEVMLNGGVIGQTGESGELMIPNVRIGIHLAEIRHPDIDNTKTFVRVDPGRKAVVNFTRADADNQKFKLAPLGENEQGYPEFQRSSDGAVVIAIPEGEFLMGNKNTERSPLEHMVFISGFLMDKTGVTWKQYKQFIAETGISLPPHNPYWGIVDDQPAVFVTWEESKAYCEWAGGRLPTEAEREKAARGLDGRLYPWGNQEPTDELGVFRKSWGYAGPGAVAARPAGASPYGLLDAGGNVWEWCSDWYSGDYYGISPYYNPQGPETGNAHVVRGGSWDSRPAVLSASCRNWGHRGYRDGDFGFRCAMNDID